MLRIPAGKADDFGDLWVAGRSGFFMSENVSEALSLISTAQERLANIRKLAALTGDARDEHDPDELNEAFRAVHSLAGVLPNDVKFSGHVLCNRLDDMRMGKLGLTAHNINHVLAGLGLLALRLERPEEGALDAFSVLERELAKLGRKVG